MCCVAELDGAGGGPECSCMLQGGMPPVQKVDLWRMVKVYHEGGLYMDIDRWVNRRLGDVIPADARTLMPISLCTRPCPDVEDPQMRKLEHNFAQDIVLSAAGNPILLSAIELNVARQKKCKLYGVVDKTPKKSGSEFELPAGDADSEVGFVCGRLLDLGPKTYTQGMSKCLLGRPMKMMEAQQRTVQSSAGRKDWALLRQRLEVLAPYAVVGKEENYPWDTLLFDNQHRNSLLEIFPTQDTSTKQGRDKLLGEFLHQKKRFYCESQNVSWWGNPKDSFCGGLAHSAGSKAGPKAGLKAGPKAGPTAGPKAVLERLKAAV